MSDHETKADAPTPTNMKAAVYRAFVNKLEFWNHMPVLIRVFSKKNSYRERGKTLQDKKKMCLRTMLNHLNHVTNMACCGELKAFIQDYARHSKFIGPAAEDDGQSTSLLKKRIVVYDHMENKGQQYDNARFGILQALHGVRGYADNPLE
jgi:hypothetical protein